MAHEHCARCYSINCIPPTSSCLLITCPHGCSLRMHQCKYTDHELLCPNIFIPCLNQIYGCTLTIRRCDLSKHLRICPASIVVCSYIYNHNFNLNDNNNDDNNLNLIDKIARRDNIWYEHIDEYEKKYLLKNKKRRKSNPNEDLIRSEKYPYITMPQCMLSRGSNVICSACRNHLRQLEENEEQRLEQLTEEERKMMLDFTLNFDRSSSQLLNPSLVQMSSTLMNSTDMSLPQSTSRSDSNEETSENEIMPIISDIDSPLSYLYRLNFFSSKKFDNSIKINHKSPRFYCHALCRRDEIEQHWHIHFNVDCILNTSLIEQCPKTQYGCTFQYERLEPCQHNGQSIRIRFDEMNDAIAFEFNPNLNEEDTDEKLSLLDLPSEIIEKILLQLDSLSLRNISFVCRRLRTLCQDVLPSRGIVVTEYERNPLTHGDVTWVERRKHWLFTNTASSVPKWQLKSPNKSTSLTQHLITCPYGEIKDLQNEPRFPLLAWSKSDIQLKPT